MINSNTHKTSFDIRLPHDPQSKCNKIITKGYSLCICLLNISVKIGISLGIILILLSQVELPQEVINEITNALSNKNSSSDLKVFKDTE